MKKRPWKSTSNMSYLKMGERPWKSILQTLSKAHKTVLKLGECIQVDQTMHMIIIFLGFLYIYKKIEISTSVLAQQQSKAGVNPGNFKREGVVNHHFRTKPK